MTILGLHNSCRSNLAYLAYKVGDTKFGHIILHMEQLFVQQENEGRFLGIGYPIINTKILFGK